MDELVLSWQIEDICNQDLYKDQVKKIPDEFQSIDEYLESYTLPLIEETRAELFSGLEMISEAPCAEIQHIELCDTKFGLVCKMLIPVDGFAGKTGSTNMYEPKNGDAFILSSLRPESIDDLLLYGVSYCFAIVKKVVEVKLEKVVEVKLDEVMVKQFTMSVSPTMTSVDEIQRCTFALYLTNTVTNSRIWKVLHYNGVDQNFTLIKKVLSRNQMAESRGGSTNGQNNPEITRLVDQLLSIDLNQSQLKAVKSTISSVRCNKLNAINLVWGPPGTGKTKTVGSILWSLKQLKIRTLTCAPTNVAVLGVCSRLVQLIKNFDGNNGDSIGPPLSLADVVLFGNRGRMDIVGDLEDVFLDSRIKRLENCFLSESDWRHGVASMIHFLEDCVNMYDNKDNKDNLGFGDYLRQNFKKLQKNLSNCFRTMFVHLPRRFLSSENLSRIVSLQDLLREISGMLSSSVITDEQLKLTFGTPACIFFPREKLLEAREECFKQLRDLNETLTLSVSSLTNGCSIKDFCLHNATLVFCTASSSFSLHNAQTSCFDVVVIDEAAQLKECESVIPLTLNHVKHALLVGDECQLPALVQSRVSKRAGFGRSLFERLVSLQHEKHLLNVQYRMHPSISLFPNNRFYDGQILNGPNVLEEGYNNNYMDFKFGSYAFLHIADGIEENDEVGKSWINWVEVAVIVHLVKSLYESWNRMKGKLTIGIISPYTAQVRTIKDKIHWRYNKYNHEGFEVRVKSIDGFQGQEDDVIILSMVRCNTKGSVGFLYDNQRTNVAVTRARHCLWIVGSATTMSNSGTVWSEIAFDAKQRGYLFDAKDVEDLANLILNAKNEQDQLVDIMNENSVLFSSTRWKKPNNPSHDGFASAMTIKLHGKNFYLWSQMLKMKLSERDKLGYIDGTILQPSPTDGNYQRWLVDDSVVKACMINSMDSSLIGNFVSYSTAKEMWDAVCTTYFDGNDLSQILDLKRKINQVKQMGGSTENYYNQLQGLWKEIDIRRPNPMEYVVDIEKYEKLVQEDRVLIFLDGLDNRLDYVRARVLQVQPFPTVKEAFALVRKEEIRQKVMLNKEEETNNSMVMLAEPNYTKILNYNYTMNKPNYTQILNYNYTMNKPNYTQILNYNQNFKPPNLEGCTYCHNPKHTKDKCYKLIGYPEWWKDPRKMKQGEYQPQKGEARAIMAESATNRAAGLAAIAASPATVAGSSSYEETRPAILSIIPLAKNKKRIF